MFGRLGAFVFGFIVGGVCLLGALKYHVVHAEDGIHLVPKLGASLKETYVDIREFTPSDWADHRRVAAAMVQADKAHLMKGTVVDSLFDSVDGLLKSLND
ncbi:MAG: hypothetical protein WBF93_16295 [Pirellulales bacterium]|jgi:hypothetical protein|nr:hypothetical protein [Pirellulales bacterium]